MPDSKEPQQPSSAQSPRGRSRPNETLPTDRIAIGKQLNLLVAYGALYEQSGEPVSNENAGGVVGLSAGTTSLANAFFSDVGFLVRSEGGRYIPSNEVLSFHRVQQWDPESAGTELSPLLSGTWFAQALLPKLALGPLSEQAALQELSKRASASPHYRPQLRMLLDYLILAGVLRQDGDQLRRGSDRTTKAAPQSSSEESAPAPIRPSRDPDLHPFVQGLLQELPAPGTVWPESEQQAWIAGWKVAFGFLYKTRADDSPEVRVALTPSSLEGTND